MGNQKSMLTAREVAEFRAQLTELAADVAVPAHLAFTLIYRTEDDDTAFEPDHYGERTLGTALGHALVEVFLSFAGVDGEINGPECLAYWKLLADTPYERDRLPMDHAIASANQACDLYTHHPHGGHELSRDLVECVQAYDWRYGTSHAPQLRHLLARFAEMICRADGALNGAERRLLAGLPAILEVTSPDCMRFDLTKTDTGASITEMDALATSLDAIVSDRADQLDAWAHNEAFEAATGFWLEFAGVYLGLAMTDGLLPIDKWRAFKTVFAHDDCSGWPHSAIQKYGATLATMECSMLNSLGLIKILDVEQGTSYATRLEAVMIRLAALAARPANGRISREQELRLFDLVTAICAPFSSYGKDTIETKAGKPGRQAKPGRLRSNDDSRVAASQSNRHPVADREVDQP